MSKNLLQKLKHRIAKSIPFLDYRQRDVYGDVSCTINRIPIEVLEQVFELSCKDGNRIGCSLSLVSKYIRDASRAARFHSVCLYSDSADQVAQFLNCLNTERGRATGSQPKVRHLYLAAAKRNDPYDWNVHGESDPEQDKYTEDVSALIRLVAPDLYTLSLTHGHHDDWTRALKLPREVGRTNFPELRELSLYGAGLGFAPVPPTFMDDTEDTAHAATAYPPLPHLSRLHLAFTDEEDNWSSLNLRRWAERAPSITHLRLTNLAPSSSRSIMREIVLLGNVEAEHLFDHFELLLVQPTSPPPRGGYCATVEIAFNQMRMNLSEFHKKASRQWGLGPYFKHLTEQKLKKTARREWLDRLDDKPGCWGVDRSWYSGKHAMSI